MLLGFQVKNFLSIKDVISFSMIAKDSNKRHMGHVIKCGKYNVLKGSLLFGANAAGKSSFIKAISFLKNIVVRDLQSENLEKKHFRVEVGQENKPGIFQVDIYTNGRVYTYGLAISYKDSYVVEEWLYELKDDSSEICIFYRGEKDDGSLYCDTELVFSKNKEQDVFQTYCNGMKNKNARDVIFLKDLYKHLDNNMSIYKQIEDVYSWFQRLEIVFPESKYKTITNFYGEKNNNIFGQMLANFDTGIEKVSTIKKNIEAEATIPQFLINDIKRNLMTSKTKMNGKFNKAMIGARDELLEVEVTDEGIYTNRLGFSHGNEMDKFELMDESDGTKRLVHLLPLLQEGRQERIIFVDELDRSLHTMAVIKFLEKFYEMNKGKYTQIISTIQDLNLLDLQKVREDEIWFVERQQNHASKLYPLSQYRLENSDIRKDYLVGRYGAIPRIFDFCEDDDCAK